VATIQKTHGPYFKMGLMRRHVGLGIGFEVCVRRLIFSRHFLKEKRKDGPRTLLTKVEMSQTWSKWWFSFLFPRSDIHNKYKVPSKYTSKFLQLL